MSYPKRLVIMRFSAMGDVALMIPVIVALRKKYPDVEIFTLSQKRNNKILQQIHGIRTLEARLETEHKGVLGMYRLAKQLKDLEIDAIADMHNVIRTKMLRTFLSGVRKSVLDKGRKEKKQLVSDPSFFQPLKHTTTRYLEALQSLVYDLDLNGGEQLPKLPMPKDMSDRLHLQGCQLVGFAPFAAHKTKALTLKKARKIVQALSENKNITIVLIGGGEKECRKLQVVAGTTAHVVNLAGITTFENELAVISNLDVMIAMDSGNGHIAAAYGVPTITIWGNTHPYAGFAPYGQPEENQLIANRERYPLIPTSIYGNKKVKGYQKATCSVKIKAIVERVNEILYPEISAQVEHE